MGDYGLGDRWRPISLDDSDEYEPYQPPQKKFTVEEEEEDSDESLSRDRAEYEEAVHSVIDKIKDEAGVLLSEPLTRAEALSAAKEYLLRFTYALAKGDGLPASSVKKVESLITGYSYDEMLEHTRNAAKDPENPDLFKDFYRTLIVVMSPTHTPNKKIQEDIDLRQFQRTPAEMREEFKPTSKPNRGETIYKQVLREFIDSAAEESTKLLRGGRATAALRFDAAFNNLLEYYNIAAMDPKCTRVALDLSDQLEGVSFQGLMNMMKASMRRKKPRLPYERDICRVADYLLTHRFDEDQFKMKKK